MSEIIPSVKGSCTVERVVEKSRFIACAAHVESEEEARSLLAKIKAAHPLATHHCYGFIADKTGAMQRFSDDGEPQGTAGMPILDVIKNKGLYETAVVVTRYFGGVKLGAGGLVRAYSAAAAQALDEAEICLWQLGAEFSVQVDYSLAEGLKKFFVSSGCVVLACEYAHGVAFTVLVRKPQEKEVLEKLTDFTAGKATCTPLREYYYPFSEA